MFFLKNIPIAVIYPCEEGSFVLDSNSSEKFASFVDQVDREGLHLLILANFKGFSGGDRDMKNGILKYGAKILEKFQKFRKKVFVYIGREWQVRGGTFVILDKFLNHKIRVYASKDSKIGVLQPDGLSEVKFKENMRKEILIKK